MSETEQEQTPDETPDETPGETPTPIQPPDEEEAAEEEATIPEAESDQPEASAPAGAVGERELEKMFKRVETANSAYLKKLEGIMEAEISVLEPCPRCSDPFLGLIFPPLMRPASEEVKAKVLVSVGEEPSEATEKDNYARQCDSCKGAGVTLSGSRRARDRILSCHDCGGRGWVPVGPERQGQSTARPEVAATNGTEVPANEQPEVDLWGTPIGDPDYGVMPQYRARPLPLPRA